MGTIVTYNGNQSDPVKRNTAYLPTAGKYMTGDITITDTGMDADDCVCQDKDGFIVLNDSYGTYVDKETLEITKNGTYTAPERKVWNKLDVKVPSSGLFKSIVDRSITEIKAEDFNDVTTLLHSQFRECTQLKSVNLPSVTTINHYVFMGCSQLESVHLPNVTSISTGGIFYLCYKLKKVVLPSVNGFNGDHCHNSGVEIADLGPDCASIGGNLFYGASNFTILILRRETCVTMGNGGNTNVFGGDCPFHEGKSGGTLYIPKVLYDHLNDGSSLDYYTLTNWSTYLQTGAITFATIEGSIYETQYADGTPIT